jgi:hypothetical protein
MHTHLAQNKSLSPFLPGMDNVYLPGASFYVTTSLCNSSDARTGSERYVAMSSAGPCVDVVADFLTHLFFNW